MRTFVSQGDVGVDTFLIASHGAAVYAGVGEKYILLHVFICGAVTLLVLSVAEALVRGVLACRARYHQKRGSAAVVRGSHGGLAVRSVAPRVWMMFTYGLVVRVHVDMEWECV